MSIVKLSLPFAPAAVEDLRQRLRAPRWPDEIAGSDWEYGFSLHFLQELCEYWVSQIRLEIAGPNCCPLNPARPASCLLFQDEINVREVEFAAETRRSNLRGIPSPKSKRVRRTRIPTTSLVTARSALSLGGSFLSWNFMVDPQIIVLVGTGFIGIGLNVIFMTLRVPE